MASHKISATLAAGFLGLGLCATTVPAAQASVGSARAVTAIGDSYPAGSMGNEHNGYVERYGRMTHQKALNWAFPGWRSGDVMYQMHHTPIEMRNIRDSRTVIITAGANDISETIPDPSRAATTLAPYRGNLQAMRRDFHTLLGMVSKARGGNNRRVVVTTYNNIYGQGRGFTSTHSRSFVYGANRLSDQVNAVILAECRAYHMTCVDVRPYFNASKNVSSLVIADGTHPSSAGHQLYANRIYATVH